MARWRFGEPESGMVEDLARAAGVDPLCARVLANRGVGPEDAAVFLEPSLKAIGMPEGEPWEAAARRVAKAVKGGRGSGSSATTTRTG